ncbi:MAG: hypothetical protein M0T74_04095 [Desulfitobacterium hafniense]|nr:hypothetical protein [Desulfitobacterium hafniense]
MARAETEAAKPESRSGSPMRAEAKTSKHDTSERPQKMASVPVMQDHKKGQLEHHWHSGRHALDSEKYQTSFNQATGGPGRTHDNPP